MDALKHTCMAIGEVAERIGLAADELDNTDTWRRYHADLVQTLGALRDVLAEIETTVDEQVADLPEEDA